MILAIVGAMVLIDSEKAVTAVIEDALDRWAATNVVSGGAPGVDLFAQRAAERRGWEPIICLPAAKSWEHGYKPRNMKIAETCDALLRIASRRSRTYGSGWTRDYAARLGKPTEEVVLP